MAEQQGVTAASEEVPHQAVVLASDDENADPACGGGEAASLRKLFAEGQAQIATARTDNLFQSLDQRSLTDEEQKIIEQRVALQRKMFEEYERRERQRKVVELRDVCPDISEGEALKALELCSGREDEAAAQLVSDPAFKRRVQAACGASVPPEPRHEAARAQSRPSRPAGPRPKLIDPATLGNSVFVGAFRGKGFKPAPKSKGASSTKQPAAPSADVPLQAASEEQAAGAAASGDAASGDQSISELDGSTQQGDDDAVAAAAAASGRNAAADEAQSNEQPEPEHAAASPVPAGSPALVHPSAPDSVPKEYVLAVTSSDGVLRAPTDAELERELQAAPARSGGQSTRSVGPAPAAKDATLLVMARALEKQGVDKARAALQKMPVVNRDGVMAHLSADFKQQLEAPEQHVQSERPGEAAAASGRPRAQRKAAAAARQTAKRAALAESDEDSEAQTEEDASSSDDEEISEEEEEDVESEDEDFAPSASRRARAPRPAAGTASASRPSRRAKSAAMATFAADAADEDDDEGWAEPSPAAKSAPRSKRGRSAQPAAATGDALTAGGPAEAADSAVMPAAPPAKKQRRDELAVAAAEGAAEQATAPADEPTSAPGAMDTDPQPHQADGAGVEEPAVQLAAGDEEAAAQPAARDEEPAAAEPSAPEGVPADEQPPPRADAPAANPPRVRAISTKGHTCRGRVKQKSHKAAELVEAGTLRAQKGWFNAGYIFPEGFHSRTLFRSSVAIDQLCVHDCHIIGQGGQYWPAPTFQVVAMDRPEEPLIAKSCTGCWTGILKRINSEIEARRKAGEDLPPPPKTAIAGPEYFGFNQHNIQDAVEALDPDHQCTEYWAGKQDREHAAAGLPLPSAPAAQRAPRVPRPPPSSKRSRGGKGRRGRDSGSEDEGGGAEAEDDDEAQYMTNRWSAVSRSNRYKKRLAENGDDTSAVDEDNPLSDFIDPITLEAVVRPAISPYGHVMGLATWKAVLAEHQQCPFTKQPLRWEQCKVLTKTNIHLYRDAIIR